MLRLMTIAKESLDKEFQTGCSMTHQYSAISKHSSLKGTPKAIRAWLMSLPGAFPVNPSQLPAKEQEKTTQGICGRPPGIPLALFDHGTSSWRMSQACFLTDTSGPLSERLPKWGMTSTTVSLERMTLEPLTDEKDGGVEQKGDTNVWRKIKERRPDFILQAMREPDGKETIQWAVRGSWEIQEQELLQPSVFFEVGKAKCKSESKIQPSEKIEGEILRTLFERKEHTDSSQKQRHNEQQERKLADCVCQLSQYDSLGREKKVYTGYVRTDFYPRTMPGLLTGERGGGVWLSTPTARMSIRSEQVRNSNRLPQPNELAMGKSPMKKDGGARRTWPTPRVCDNEDKDNAQKGQLNPDWVCWLMGWPIGWTSIDSLTELIWLDWSVDPSDRRNDGPIPRIAVGVKDWVNKLKALGNGQVPQCVKLAWEVLNEV